MKIIHTENAPKAVGPYSQATIANNLLFTAGQIALDPISGEMVGEDIRTQTAQVLKNLDAVLVAADSDKSNVTMCTVYLVNLGDFSKMNEVYADFFGNHRPARVAVEVSALPKGALVEISAIATL